MSDSDDLKSADSQLRATGEEPKLKPDLKEFEQIRDLKGHTRLINRVAWSPDNVTLATTSYDNTIRLWNLTTRAQPVVLTGHSNWVSSTAWSPNGKYLVSGSGDLHLRLWDVAAGKMVESVHAHARTIFDVAWSLDGQSIVTASADLNIGVWDPHTMKPKALLQGHSAAVHRVVWSPNGRLLASASQDGMIRLWDTERWTPRHIYEGHAGAIYDLAWSPRGLLASASEDNTIRLWGRQSAVLEGHTDIVTSVSFSYDGNFMASKSLDGTVRLWRCDTWEPVKVITELSGSAWTSGLAFHPKRAVLATLGAEDYTVRVWKFNGDALRKMAAAMPMVRYTNAKVVLVGDSGVGKTSLGNALMGKSLEPTFSTHGRHIHRFDVQEHVLGNGTNEIREIFLWDMAGQPSYRLIHQLHLNEVVVALVVFDVKSDTDPFAGVRHWNRALHHAHRVKGKGQIPLSTYLVAARVDRGGVGVSQHRIDAVTRDMAFDGYFETSATANLNIVELNAAIRNSIDWDQLPKVNSTHLFQSIKNFINRVREKGLEQGEVLHTADKLYDTFIHTPGAPQEAEVDNLRDQFDTCIGLVEARGLVRRFSFGGLILLQPEILDSYASAMIVAARDEPDGMGMMVEEDVRQARFKMPADERIDDKAQEQLLLAATVEDLLKHEIVMRDDDENNISHLVFPSQSTRTTPRPPEQDARTAIWSFEGPVLNIYTTLAVRMWHTGLFAYREMYENAVFYETGAGGKCRLFFTNMEEGHAEITLYFDEQVTSDTQARTEDFVQSFLNQRSIPGTLKRRRLFICPNCNTAVTDAQVQRRRERGFKSINCPACDTAISFSDRGARDSMSQSFLRQQRVLQLDKQADLQRQRQVVYARLEGRRLTGDFDVFLCHNGADKEDVKRIGELLKEHEILPWLDEWELPPGQLWPPLVQEQLLTMNLMLFFVGPNGIGNWQDREVFTFMDLKRKIIPVFLPTAPRRPELPPFLKQTTWVDFRRNDPDPLKQLIWGIRGDRPQKQQPRPPDER